MTFTVRNWIPLAGIVLFFSIGSCTGDSEEIAATSGKIDVSQRAVEIAREAIIVDGHVDFPTRLAAAEIDPLDSAGQTDFDFKRAMAGGFNAPFMSIYVSAHYQNNGTARARADQLIDIMEGVAAEYPDQFAIARSPDDMRAITDEGKIAMAFGMENGAPIGDDLAALDYFYDRGIRYITLAHSRFNQISDSSYDLRRPWGGLSPFGEKVVKRMNALGILIDVSHISDDAFYDVMAVSTAPVIASHSGARHFTPGFERNMSDDMIVRLADNGGIIMINYGTHFLTRAGSERRIGRPDTYQQYLTDRQLEDTPEVYREFRKWFDENVPVPYAHVRDVVDHIDHVRDLVGIEHIGLGSDFDGVGDTLPTGLKDVSGMPVLIQEMLNRGYTEEEIRSILGENLLRVWSEAAAATQTGTTASTRINAAMDELYHLRLSFYPEFATSEGVGPLGGRWDPTDRAADEVYEARFAEIVSALREEVDLAELSFEDRVSLDLLLYDAERARANSPYSEHRYLFSHMYGQHSELPTFLINKHKASSRPDLETYLARLSSLDDQLDGYRQRASAAAAKGIRPPAFLYDRVIKSARAVITGVPFNDGEAISPLYADALTKMEGLELDEASAQAYRNQAQRILTDEIGPAYERLIAYLEEDKAQARDAAGVWALPDGAAYYRERLRTRTTTDMTPDEIHDLGLREVTRLRGEVEAVMTEVGFGGTVTEFFDAVRADERFYLPNTEGGREQYRAQAEEYVNGIMEIIDTQFLTTPGIPLVVKRVEPFREASAGKAFYSRGAPDGSRPGIFYVNTVDTADLPTYMLEGRAYHEGAPGHHMQIATVQELGTLSAYRRAQSYTAYNEGWALYSERLAREMGLYKDPYSNFGRIARELWRATRLVTDTGIHHKRWSRQQAIEYLMENSPHPEGAVTAAIDRYSAMPGQATAYSIGMLKILELRERAQTELGAQYDQRAFHQVVVSTGSVPLSVLEAVVDHWIEENKRKN